MPNKFDRGIAEYHLEPSGHPRGVSCDTYGPALGPIRLLAKTDNGFEPRSAEELCGVLEWTFGQPFDCTNLSRGLRVVANALNEGDIARAMMATLFLRLPALSAEEGVRADQAVTMLKASPSDPKHPGWPKGTPEGLGGKFRPKTGELAEEATELVERRVRRLVLRRAIRVAMRRLLNWRRLLRLGGEAASNAVPGLDVAGDAAMAVDLVQMAEDVTELRSEAQVAEKFADGGPYTLEQLRARTYPDDLQQDEEFSSFRAFKKIDLIKRFGPPPDGYEYHHIVEQSAEGDIPVTEINSTRNIVAIPKLVHEEINSEYSRIPDDVPDGTSLRDSLQGASFEKRWQEGLEAMRRVGFLK